METFNITLEWAFKLEIEAKNKQEAIQKAMDTVDWENWTWWDNYSAY